MTVATSVMSAQADERDRGADGRGVGELGPVPVRRLQQLGALVLGRRVEPQPARGHVEVATVLAEPALAEVDDLLAFEQRVHDRRPFLERGNGNLILDAGPMGELLVTHARIGLDGDDGRRRRGDRLGRPAAGCALLAPVGMARVPGLIVLPGFPRGQGAAATVGNTYASLADRISREAGWAALTFTIRGTGTSEGDFSIEGWLADVRAAIDAMHARTDLTGVWLAGFRLGGSLAIVAAAHDQRVRGLASFSAPASLKTWVDDPAWFLEYARRTGVLRNPEYPPDPARWIRAIANLDILDAAAPHRAAPVVAGARLGRRRRARRGRAPVARRGRRLHRDAHRAERSAPPPPRPARIAALLGWFDRQGP